MATLTRKPIKKPARAKSIRLAPALRAVDKDGRFILGYASAVASERPGVDLTKPTAAIGRYL